MRAISPPRSEIPRVFVSSTFKDLQAHRSKVIADLQKAGLIVDPMESWPADSEGPTSVSVERVGLADLVILLTGFRRGFVPDGSSLSITQLEYAEALRRRIAVTEEHRNSIQRDPC